MADQPDGIILKRHRDLEGMGGRLWIRRAIVVVFLAIPVIALFNVFGQRPDTSFASTQVASLKLYAPSHLRGGLLFSARFHIRAKQDVKDAVLLLDSGWAEGMSINTVEPSPLGQASRNGKLVFDLGHVPAGQSYILYLQIQVNPTNVALDRPQNVQLFDGSTHLLTIRHAVTIFP